MALSLVTALTKSFSKHQKSSLAEPMAAYMKHKFAYHGIQKPTRALLQKELFKAHPITSEHDLTQCLVSLWAEDKREYQYAAMDLAYQYRKLWSAKMLTTFEQLIRDKSWWDTVDILAGKLVGTLLLEHPELQAHMHEWIDDDDLWIRRTALLYQLHYKERTDSDRLFSYCQKRMHEQEFFIRKAIGWVLRQYSKTEPEQVKRFVSTYKDDLSPLSYREATKYIPL